MNDYLSYGLDSFHELSALSLDISMGLITPKEAVDLLRGHPCEDELFALHPELKDYTEPPDDDTSSST